MNTITKTAMKKEIVGNIVPLIYNDLWHSATQTDESLANDDDLALAHLNFVFRIAETHVVDVIAAHDVFAFDGAIPIGGWIGGVINQLSPAVVNLHVEGRNADGCVQAKAFVQGVGVAG